MRARKAGLAVLIAATGIWMSLSAGPAMSATKPTAKKEAKTTVAAANRPIILAKFKKQKRVSAAKKSRTAQARHLKKSGSKATSRAASQKTAAREAAPDASKPEAKSELPPDVANARAQALADDEARNIAALDSAKVSDVNGVLVAANDRPGDNSAPMDSAAVAQDAAPAAPQPVASPPPVSGGKIIRAVPSGDKPVAAKTDDSDPWSKTSLIGKIFIAFGSLLTLASAARLLIA